MATSVSKLTTKPGTMELSSFAWFLSFVLPLLYFTGKSADHSFLFHAGLFFTGWISWTYTEYFFHRFIQHETGKKTKLRILLNHSHHHHDPHDIRITGTHRFLMIVGSLILISLAILLNNYFTLFCGYFFGFTFYSLLHLFLHYRLSAMVFPQLHRSHIHHHCKHPDKCFGVTVTWWDHLFGTFPQTNTEISGKVLAFYYKTQMAKNNFPLSGETDKKQSEKTISITTEPGQQWKNKQHDCANCGKPSCSFRDQRATN